MSKYELRDNKLAAALSYLYLIVAGAGFSVALLLNNRTVLIASLLLVIPLVLAGIILLINRHKENFSGFQDIFIFKDSMFVRLLLFNCSLFFVSLILLISFETRPLLYFIIISMMAGINALQIFCNRPAWADLIILLQIIALSLNIIWGVTLKYPLYFGDMDILGHIQYIQSIIETGSTTTYENTYSHYAVYHIFNAIGVEVTGLQLTHAMFLIMGLFWQVGTITVYSLIKRVAKGRNIALLSCLLFALSSQILFYGTYSIARSAAFILFLVIVFLLVLGYRNNLKAVILSMIVVTAFIMTHHLTTLYIIGIFLLLAIISLVSSRSNRAGVITMGFLSLYSVAALGYLFFVSNTLIEGTLPAKINQLLHFGEELVLDPLKGYGTSALLGQIYYSFILMLCAFGFYFILRNRRNGSISNTGFAFCATGLIMLPILLPGPLSLFPGNAALWITRSAVLTTPFVILLAAFGLHYVITSFQNSHQRTSKLLSSLVVLLILSSSCFFSLIGTGNANDSDYFPHTKIVNTPYFTQSELVALSYINNMGNWMNSIYADYRVVRHKLAIRNFEIINTIPIPGIENIQSGYLYVRNGELEKKGLLMVRNEDTRELYNYRPSNSDIGISKYFIYDFAIYNNGYVTIYNR